MRNIFLVYLFTSAVTDRYEIFAAICASFPFILPIVFDGDGTDFVKRTGKSLLYGVLGCTASVLFMAVTGSYSTTAWLVPALYGFIMCVGYSAVCGKLTAHKRTVMKCIISVSVCFLAFV